MAILDKLSHLYIYVWQVKFFFLNFFLSIYFDFMVLVEMLTVGKEHLRLCFFLPWGLASPLILYHLLLVCIWTQPIHTKIIVKWSKQKYIMHYPLHRWEHKSLLWSVPIHFHNTDLVGFRLGQQAAGGIVIVFII